MSFTLNKSVLSGIREVLHYKYSSPSPRCGWYHAKRERTKAGTIGGNTSTHNPICTCFLSQRKTKDVGRIGLHMIELTAIVCFVPLLFGMLNYIRLHFYTCCTTFYVKQNVLT